MTFRLALRDALSHVLGRIPLALLRPLRITKRESFQRYRWYHPRRFLLGIIHYRKLDPSIEFFQLSEEPPLYFANDNSSFSRRLFWQGKAARGAREAELWAALCAQATGILEIGANVGYFTVLGASAARTIPYTAVEPHPVTVSYLRKNLQLNHLDHVEVIEAAVVGKKTSDTLQLYVPKADPDSTPAGAYLAGGEAVPRSQRDVVTVAVVEASGLFREGTDLLKLDVEGYESEILNSLLPQLLRHRPTIFVEVRRHTPTLREFIRRLSSEARYSIYAVGKETLYPLSSLEILHIVLEDVYGTKDVLLTADAGRELSWTSPSRLDHH